MDAAGLIKEGFFKSTSTNGNLNTMETGYNTIDTSTENIPPVSDTGVVGFVLCFAPIKSYRFQLAFCFANISVWYRCTASGPESFSSWKQIA